MNKTIFQHAFYLGKKPMTRDSSHINVSGVIMEDVKYDCGFKTIFILFQNCKVLKCHANLDKVI